jgi:hypothetical protein
MFAVMTPADFDSKVWYLAFDSCQFHPRKSVFQLLIVGPPIPVNVSPPLSNATNHRVRLAGCKLPILDSIKFILLLGRKPRTVVLILWHGFVLLNGCENANLEKPQVPLVKCR